MTDISNTNVYDPFAQFNKRSLDRADMPRTRRIITASEVRKIAEDLDVNVNIVFSADTVLKHVVSFTFERKETDERTMALGIFDQYVGWTARAITGRTILFVCGGE